jgi:hypothetical protein
MKFVMTPGRITTQRYAHLQQDPAKAAAEFISGKIDKAMKAKPTNIRRVK